MKVSLKWLKDYLDLTLPAEKLAEKLTLAGLEVTGMTKIGYAWGNVVIGKIINIAPHPRADRLQLVTVDIGTGQTTVVCGAPNIKVGDKVPLAQPGARLIDPHTGKTTTLEPALIRGILSEGMLCSEKELGISERHEGILILPDDAPVGVSLADYLGDIIWEVDVTPNRPDCLSILGVARELAALTGKPIREPEIDYIEKGPPIQEIASVEILAPDLCPRYCAGVILGVNIAPSPSWLRERLLSYGLRPINNIVDVTNYVMLELGQPLHAFDLDKLAGRKIIVRQAFPVEKLITLDGIERQLSSEMLVIADKDKPVAIAGVIGGLESSVTEDTKAILLESANFNYINIRRTEAALKLHTESSLRFGKGLSPELPYYGLKQAMKLMLDLAGGNACQEIIDLYPGKREKAPIILEASEVKRLLGMEISSQEIRQVLSSLGFAVSEIGPSSFSVQPPYWRSDVSLAADLVEEIARIIGYDKIPITRLKGEIPAFRPKSKVNIRERIRQLLASYGLQEVITYSLVSGEKLKKVGAELGLKVLNPLSKEQEYLRTSLRPGLLSAAALNLRHSSTVKLFEIGRIYLARGNDLPEEREVVGAVLAGLAQEVHWSVKEEKSDFYYAKGIVEAVLSGLSLEGRFLTLNDPALIPGRQAGVFVGQEYIGLVGEVHPQVAQAFELPSPVYLIELELEKFPALVTTRLYQPPSLYPEIIRDLALIVDERIPMERVKEIISSFPLVCLVKLFDVYTGPPVPPGKKSLAFRLHFSSRQRTLTDKEVDSIQEKIVFKLKQELGAELRKAQDR